MPVVQELGVEIADWHQIKRIRPPNHMRRAGMPDVSVDKVRQDACMGIPGYNCRGVRLSAKTVTTILWSQDPAPLPAHSWSMRFV